MAALGPDDFLPVSTPQQSTSSEPDNVSSVNWEKPYTVAASVKIAQFTSDDHNQDKNTDDQSVHPFCWQILDDIESHINELETRLLAAREDYQSYWYVYQNINESHEMLSETHN